MRDMPGVGCVFTIDLPRLAPALRRPDDVSEQPFQGGKP